MKISIIGCGYVGTVTGACLAENGNKVLFNDIDKKRVEMINHGHSSIYEKGLNDILSNNKKRIKATTNLESLIKKSNITFICVGTPSKKDTNIDLSFIKKATTDIGRYLKKKDTWHLVVVKSTVLPGTSEKIILPLLEKYSGKKVGKEFGLAVNPEFLREGSAVKDFLEPDRIVIGFLDEKSKDLLKKLYKDFSCPKVETSISAAEMIKYVSNAFLSTKISFANEIGNICKKLNIDTRDVFKGVGLDHRINPAFFRSGIGFGGSCFSKDVRALIAKAKAVGVNPQILQSVIDVNENQPIKMIDLLKKHMSLEGKKIGVLGLAFKPDTDDIRESRAITVVNALIKNGAKVIVYDPKAMDNFKKVFSQIEYASSTEEVLDSDAVLTTADWHEFENLDFTDKIVIDGRGIEVAKKAATIYEGVCW